MISKGNDTIPISTFNITTISFYNNVKKPLCNAKKSLPYVHWEHDEKGTRSLWTWQFQRVKTWQSFKFKVIEKRFISIASPLKDSISISCIHLPISCISEHHLKNLVCLVRNLESFQELLLKNNIDYKVLEVLFSPESKHNSLLRSLTVSLGNCCVLSSYASIHNHFVA
jgi:hypothetical protein